MTSVPSVLCPVDFSEASKVALGYAAAIASHFGARLTVLTVDDPLLAEAAANAALDPPMAEETTRELDRFCRSAIGGLEKGSWELALRVATGKPAVEILRAARELEVDLVVISSRGHGGARKMLFGSTTERVLRETPAPVLVTPADRPAGQSLSEMTRQIRRVIAPVDLTASSPRQLRIAAGIAEAISAPLIVAHVLEPIAIPPRVRLAMSGADAARRAQADEKLAGLLAHVHTPVKTETLIVSGDPSEEIVRLTEARGANLIVMGLHSPEGPGPRMGAVTYRVLCQARALVLGLPAPASAGQ